MFLEGVIYALEIIEAQLRRAVNQNIFLIPISLR